MQHYNSGQREEGGAGEGSVAHEGKLLIWQPGRLCDMAALRGSARERRSLRSGFCLLCKGRGRRGMRLRVRERVRVVGKGEGVVYVLVEG